MRISDHLLEQVKGEHDVMARRVNELRDQSLRLHAMAAQVDEQLEEASRTLRAVEELLGLSPQLSIDAFAGELRGKRLREVAVKVLLHTRGAGEVVHYREWYELVTAAGVRVAGKDPVATFLTQIGQAAEVESVRPRSGLYRLTA